MGSTVQAILVAVVHHQGDSNATKSEWRCNKSRLHPLGRIPLTETAPPVDLVGSPLSPSEPAVTTGGGAGNLQVGPNPLQQWPHYRLDSALVAAT